jgi:hypothetical protein
MQCYMKIIRPFPWLVKALSWSAAIIMKQPGGRFDKEKLIEAYPFAFSRGFLPGLPKP